MIIPKISFALEGGRLPSEDIFRSIPEECISILNWEKEFSYKPDVKFRICHNGQYLFIRFYVNERYTMALETKNGNDVYKDSCVEFFFQVDGENRYYNFEWNAAGTVCFSHRLNRKESERAPLEIQNLVLSDSSLGKAPFALKENPLPWTLTIAIPTEALFMSNIKSWSGLKGKANVYKCGDALPIPHYVTWAKIDTPTPDYHRPEFFKEINCQ